MMTTQQAAAQAPPTAITIFGAAGDLTRRKLVPSLIGLATDGLLPPGFTVVGFARGDRTEDRFRDDLRQGVIDHGEESELEAFDRHRDDIFYHRADYGDPEGYAELARRLE